MDLYSIISEVRKEAILDSDAAGACVEVVGLQGGGVGLEEVVGLQGGGVGLEEVVGLQGVGVGLGEVVGLQGV